MADITIRVGIIGAGANTQARHIPGLQAIEGVEIVSVCNRTRESSEKVAAEFGIPKICDGWTEVIADSTIDAVLIGTWPDMHCPITVAALGADKSVLCEARMAKNASEAHAMFEAAQYKPYLVAQLVPSPFTLRVDTTIKRLLAEDYIGDLLAVEVRDGGKFIDPEAPLHWRQDFDISGYNTMSLGIWYEALMRWVGEATQVNATGKVFVPVRKNSMGLLQAVRVPDHLEVIANMACGAQLHMQISAVTGLAGPTEVYLFGSKGTLRFTDDLLFGGKRGDRRLLEIPIPPEEAGGWRVEEEFINAIRGVEPVTHTTFLEGVKYMEFTEGVARSVGLRKAVLLPLTQ
ncbi:MAG: Gfo/Idh/MocA family protein [Armatimonadota bacterium]